MVKLIGILNITPDSFSDGGKFFSSETARAHTATLFNDGAAIVDVGAESTRPGATALSAGEEWQRLEPVLEDMLAKYPNKISLDSYHPENIRRACRLGSVIVNDVTGMNNPEMVAAVLESKPKVIISHSATSNIQGVHQGEPLTRIEQVKEELLDKALLLERQGMLRSQIILDPGIGFGKSPELNRDLLEFAACVPQYEVSIGYSRKRFLGEHRMDLATNLAAARIAIASGASYLRVHDIAGHRFLV